MAPSATLLPPPAGASSPAGAPLGSPSISPGGMSTAKAPPFRLPGEHFAAALFFLGLGTVGIAVAAPELASGAFLSPRVAGLTHLFTLGWITTSIMGALYQFLPVATGEPIRSVRLAHTSFALHVPGLIAFVGGLVTGRTPVMLAGAFVMGTGMLILVGNLGATLASASRRDVTWWALACATFFLGITVLFGVGLAGNLRWGYLGGGRILALGVHLHVALAGWVLMVMIGVANRLLPMFLLSHGAGDRFAKVAVRLVAAGVSTLVLLYHAPVPIARWLPALLITSGCIAFIMQARAFYARRHRKELDPGMRLAAAALVTLGVGVALAWVVLLGSFQPRIAVTYVATLLFGATLFVAAHYYKIIPFLVWYHRWGPLAGKRPVPRVSDLYSARFATAASAGLVVGASGVIVAVALGTATGVRVATLVLAAGVAILIIQMILLAGNSP